MENLVDKALKEMIDDLQDVYDVVGDGVVTELQGTRTIDTYGPDGQFSSVNALVEYLQHKFIGRK